MADSQLDFKQAMADFRAMFPHIGIDVIEKVLRQNNGVVDSTIDHLLALTVADTETDSNEYATIPSLSGSSSSSQSQVSSALNRSAPAPARSTVQSLPRPVQAEPQRVQQQQNGPAVGRLIDLDDESSSSNPGPLQPNESYTALTPWDNAPRSNPGSVYYNQTTPRSQSNKTYCNQHQTSNADVNPLYDYDSPTANALPRSTNVASTPRSQRQSQYSANEYNPNDYTEVSNSGLVLESNAFRSQPQHSAAQRSTGRDASERHYYEEAEGRRQPAPNAQPQPQPQPQIHLPHRSISMVETGRPRRPGQASTATRQTAGLSTSRQNDVNTESQHERRSSHNAPVTGQISAEMLQEKLAENQFRRRSLMQRSSSLRQPASFASGASASANARKTNPNSVDLHLDELDELSNEEQILTDEYLAIMLQNEEFVTSLRNDHEFMDELQRDALIGERDSEQTRRNDDPERDRDRARFEQRKSTIERAQRNRDSIMQPRNDDGLQLQRSDSSNRASISMFGSRRTVEPETPPNANVNASGNAGRTSDSRWANTSSARTSTANGGVQHRSAVGGTETSESDAIAGYGEDRVPDLEAFPFSRTIPPDETADIQKQLKSMRGSTKKKFAVLAKTFFSKSYRKKFTEVNQRFYKQVAAIGSEPTFGLLDEDDAEYASLQQAAALKQQPQSADSTSNQNHNIQRDAHADADADAATDADTDGSPIRHYNLDRY